MKYSTISGINENGTAVSVGRNGHIKKETAEKIATAKKLKNVMLSHKETDVRGNFYTKNRYHINH